MTKPEHAEWPLFRCPPLQCCSTPYRFEYRRIIDSAQGYHGVSESSRRLGRASRLLLRAIIDGSKGGGTCRDWNVKYTPSTKVLFTRPIWAKRVPGHGVWTDKHDALILSVWNRWISIVADSCDVLPDGFRELSSREIAINALREIKRVTKLR